MLGGTVEIRRVRHDEQGAYESPASPTISVLGHLGVEAERSIAYHRAMSVRFPWALFALFGLGCSPLPPEAMDPSDGGEPSSSVTGSSAPTTTADDDPTTSAMETGASATMGTGADSSGGGSTSARGTTGDSTGERGCVSGECAGQVCLEGECVSVTSCRELEQMDERGTLASGVYELEGGDSSTYEAYCDMDYMGGGWTLVLKAAGASPTFAWDSPLWANRDTFNAEQADLDRTEARLASWSEVSFDAVIIAMEAPIGSGVSPLALNRAVISIGDDSLFDLMSPGAYVSTALGRDTWLGLVNGSSLQDQCNQEGFNVYSDVGNVADAVAQRIGIIANETNSCFLADSRLGIGGLSGGTVMANCLISGEPTGNFAGCDPKVSPVNIPALGLVFVR